MKRRVCKCSYRFTYLHINYQIHDLYVSFHHLLLYLLLHILIVICGGVTCNEDEKIPVPRMAFSISTRKKTATTQLPATLGSTF